MNRFVLSDPVHRRRHSVFKLEYHLVLVTKYRHPVIKGELKNYLYDYITRHFEKSVCHLVEINGTEDHVHIMFETIPDLNLADFINNLKSASSRMVRKNFTEELAPYYWKPYFWSRSYFVATVSERSAEAVRHYIETQ